MIAGTLAVLQHPADERLETTFADGGRLPGLQVTKTQELLDGRPVQTGVAARSVERRKQDIRVGVNGDGEAIAIDIEPVDQSERIATEWVADVTGSGLIAAESVDGDGEFAFPFEQFYTVTGQPVKRVYIDLETLHQAWNDNNVLGDVWMAGVDAGNGSSIDYHASASSDVRPNVGLGFERPWDNRVMRGVVYESGYCAVYSTSKATDYVRFVEDELLPFQKDADEAEETDGQQTLDEGGASA